MLEYLHLTNVGPAPEMEITFAPRLNLITGDNGLGKSFLLDVAWWALTRRWPHDLNPKLGSGYPARPNDPKSTATIAFGVEAKSKTVSYESKYSPRDQAWTGKAGRPLNPGLIIYAHADGGFSVWDPARNYWNKKGSTDVQDRLPGYVFSANEVWDGLEVEINGKTTVICNGLLRDWASWIRENGPVNGMMNAVLAALAEEGEPLAAGPLVRLSVNDARDIPSIKTAYADAIPVLHASSGIRRIVALAYMLIWSRIEHTIAAEQLGTTRSNQLVMLFDEMESHLHPKWQRSILRSILNVSSVLHLNADVQLIAATHSPLILVSAEPIFDPRQDAWFDVDLLRDSGQVELKKREFIPRGTAGKWLTSDAFDLKTEGRPLEAEKAIGDAEALLKRRREGASPTEDEFAAVNQALQGVLPDTDRFWVRWSSAFEELRKPA